MIELLAPIFYAAVLSTIVALIVLILRQKGSYLGSVQILFNAAFISFALLVSLDFIKNHVIESEFIIFFSTKIGVSAILLAALALEQAALMLYKRRSRIIGKGKWGRASLKAVFSGRLNLFSFLYKGYIVSLLILTWVFTPWQPQRCKDIWGGLVYDMVFEWWYLALLGIFFITFIAYPCTLFILSSRKYKEKELARNLRLLGACWIGIATSVFIFQGLLPSLGFEMVEVGHLLCMIFLGFVAYGLKKPTILESFFKKARSYIHVGQGEHVVVLYTSKSDKMRIFASYVNEGLNGDDRVVYMYPDEEGDVVRARLAEHGVDVKGNEANGSLRLLSLSKTYLPRGVFDKDLLIRFWEKLKEDTLKKGYTHERELMDVGDLSFCKGKLDQYFDYLREVHEKLLDSHYLSLRAVNIENLGEREIQLLKRYSTRSIDMLEYANAFSETLGFSHGQMVGRKILFEFDPASDYEKAIQSFVTEALANAEPVEIFTCKGSAIHSALSNRKDIRFLLLTQRVSTPQADPSTNQVFLPANNTSLLLDTLDKTLQAYPYGNLNIVFDSLSSLVLLIGFEKTYGFMRYAAEMLGLPRVVALFLLNPTAHDKKVVSSLRDLFSNQIAYGRDGLQVIRWPETEVDTVLEPTTEISLAKKRVEER